MKSMLKKLVVVSSFGLGISMLGGDQAEAAVSNANLDVTATVSAFCNVYASGLSFNAYDPSVATDLDTNAGGGTSGVLSVDCTQNVDFALQVDAGQNGPAGGGLWSMAGSGGALGSFLGYNLFYNDGAQNPIAVSTDFATDTGDGYLNSAALANQTYTIDGVIPATQSVAGGSYADTVIVTLTY